MGYCIKENPLQSGDRKRFLGFIPISVKDCCYLYCKRNQETKWRKYSFLCFLFFPISSHLEEFKVRHVSFIVGENVVVVLFPTCVRLQRQRKKMTLKPCWVVEQTILQLPACWPGLLVTARLVMTLPFCQVNAPSEVCIKTRSPPASFHSKARSLSRQL